MLVRRRVSSQGQSEEACPSNHRLRGGRERKREREQRRREEDESNKNRIEDMGGSDFVQREVSEQSETKKLIHQITS